MDIGTIFGSVGTILSLVFGYLRSRDEKRFEAHKIAVETRLEDLDKAHSNCLAENKRMLEELIDLKVRLGMGGGS